MLALTTLIVAVHLLAASPGTVTQTPPVCVRGEALFGAKKYRETQNALWQCVIEGSTTQDQALHLAWTYKALKNYDEGFIQASGALKAQPTNEDILYMAAFLRFRQGKLEESVGFLNRAYKLRPNDWRIHQMYALNFVEVGWASAVEQELTRAIKLNPDMPELYYQLARYYYTMSHYDKSIDASRKALLLAPDYASVYDNLGMSYAGMGNTAQAEANFERAIEIDKMQKQRDEWPWVDYGAFLEGQHLAKAQTVLQEALRINPQNATANYELGLTMRNLGRDSEAVIFLTKAIKIDPTYAHAYYILSTLYRRMGERTLAAEYLSKFQRRQEIDRKNGLTSNVLSMHHR